MYSTSYFKLCHLFYLLLSTSYFCFWQIVRHVYDFNILYSVFSYWSFYVVIYFHTCSWLGKLKKRLHGRILIRKVVFITICYFFSVCTSEKYNKSKVMVPNLNAWCDYFSSILFIYHHHHVFYFKSERCVCVLLIHLKLD